MLRTIGIFQEGTARRTDISLIGLGACFRKEKAKQKEIIQSNFKSSNRSTLIRILLWVAGNFQETLENLHYVILKKRNISGNNHN